MTIKKHIDVMSIEKIDNQLLLRIDGWAFDVTTANKVDIMVKCGNNRVDFNMDRITRDDVVARYLVGKSPAQLGFSLHIPLKDCTLQQDIIIKQCVAEQEKSTICVVTHKRMMYLMKQVVKPYLVIEKVQLYGQRLYIKGIGIDRLSHDKVEITVLEQGKPVALQTFERFPLASHPFGHIYPNQEDYGFELTVDVKDLNLVQVVATYKGNHQYSDKIYVKRLHKQYDITVNIDYMNYFASQEDNKSVVRVSGWAIFATQREDVYIRVLNQAQQEIDANIFMSKRSDLEESGLMTPFDTGVGFSLFFEANSTEKYTLIIGDTHAKKVCDISPKTLLKQHQLSKLGLVKKALHHLNVTNVKKVCRFVKQHGTNGLVDKIVTGLRANRSIENDYMTWYQQHKATKEELAKQRQSVFEYNPKISILVPTYRTPERYLREMIESVIHQTYPNWELCIADGSMDEGQVVDIIKEYCEQDSRVRYKVLRENLGISGNTNECFSMASGDYIALFDHDDLLPANCLYEIVQSLQEVAHDVVYTDEDKVAEDSLLHMGPHFKPDFSWELLRSVNYITHFFVVRKEIVDEVKGFRSKYDGAQDFDFILRCCERAHSIHHIAKILYHWRIHQDSTAGNPSSKLYAYKAGAVAITDHLERVGIKGHAIQLGFIGYQTVYELAEEPKVSILIPNKDQISLLENCLQSILRQHEFSHYEIIIIENNSEYDETFAYYETLQANYTNIKVVTYQGPFNYSAINNYGASFATGEYLLLLNNDTEMLDKYALKHMVALAIQTGVGAVGAKLLYPDYTIQHAGVVIGVNDVADHVFLGIRENDHGYMNRHNLICNYSAVTAACLMTPKAVFDEVGGLDEQFVVAFNDIDYCLKLRVAGYRIAYHAFAKWLHYESKSRGYETTPEKQKRFIGEIARFKEKWQGVYECGDEFYNENLSLDKAFELRQK